MKNAARIILFFFLTVLVSLALPGGAQAQALATTSSGDKVVFGDTYQLASGETLNGNLAVLGGTATLDSGSHVNGDVALMGGTLIVKGSVSGNVSTLGGTLFLEDTSVVQGDVTMMGGALHRSADAQVNGSLVNGGFRPFQLNLPTTRWLDGVTLTPLWNFLSGMFSTLVLAALAVLVVLLWPRPTERVARAIVAQPAVTGGIGLLTVVVLPAMLILLAITILLSPLSLLGLLGLAVAILFGWIAVGMEIGGRIAGLFKQQWNPALHAGLGVLVLGLITNGLGWVICLGWIVPTFAALVGLGGVVVTRFGTQFYPAPADYAPLPAAPYRPMPPAPPAAPISPAVEDEQNPSI